MLNSLLKYFRKQPLSIEAYHAYINKLPQAIHVQWVRDDGFIVGEIQADDKYLMTQAKSAEEFV